MAGIPLSGSLQGGGTGIQTAAPIRGASGGIQLTATPAGSGGIQLSNGAPSSGGSYPPDYNAAVAADAAARASSQVYAPALNLTDVYNKQRGGAESAVNPYYSLKLKQFVDQQTADKVQKQKQSAMDIQAMQDKLAATLASNATTKTRTGEDVLNNEQQLAIKADQTQQDQGTAFDTARIALAKENAVGGLTTSGQGAGKVLLSTADRNTQEGRQAADVAQQNQTQELFKSRTFEDLATSGDLATKGEAKGEAQTNFDLNNFIDQQGRDYTTTTTDLEKSRQIDLASKQKDLSKIAVNNFIQSISDPAKRLAAAQQYGNSF